ncbi:MAG: (2Fe-2S)-binding protein [Candidatus Latescibacterota bacterium]|nr:MAG: (2Fe-2S)-binding protein [Candidatus Latescibacterota bacterium]
MISRNVTFFFEGHQLNGVRGEPIAKALFDAGIKTLSYSVKYKRPRGLHCARGRCVMCHMSVNGTPGVPTCITPLEEGMRIERENYQPVFGPFLTAVARLLPLPAGFYYRSFTKPSFLREFFVRTVRKMAGVGRLGTGGKLRVDGDAAAEEDRTPQGGPRIDGLYDVAVVGGGITGMAVAVSSAETGAKVLLVDEYPVPGGHSIGYQSNASLAASRDRLIESVAQHPSVHYHPNTTALGFYPPDTLLLGPGGSTGFEPCLGPTHTSSVTAGAARRRAMTRIRARSFVFATGAYDVVPVFENNDMPGIFGSRAIRLLLERDGLRPGKRAVVYGTGPALGQTAELLLHHEISVAALIDPSDRFHEAVTSSKKLGDISRISGARVIGTKGKDWISAVTVANGIFRGGDRPAETVLPCDLFCTAFAGQGAYELPHQAGFEFSLPEASLDENRVLIPDRTRVETEPGSGITCYVVGEAAGETLWNRKIDSGKETGKHAARPLDS